MSIKAKRLKPDDAHLLVVNISDMKFSGDPEDVIVTYSLGSCLGVTAFDPQTGLGAMIHCLLPTDAAAKEKSRANPYMFVNTGVTAMVRRLLAEGAARERLVFKAAGGANMRNDTLFRTGARNLEALERLLAKNDVALAASEVGGSIPRTMYLHMDTGAILVRSLGKEKAL